MASAAGAADLRPSNVSVTPINVDNTDYYKTSSNGVTVNVSETITSSTHHHYEQIDHHHKQSNKETVNVITEHSTSRSTQRQNSDSDSEVAQIDFHSSAVNLRTKNGEGKVLIPKLLLKHYTYNSFIVFRSKKFQDQCLGKVNYQMERVQCVWKKIQSI